MDGRRIRSARRRPFWRRVLRFAAWLAGIAAAFYGVLAVVASMRPPAPGHEFFRAGMPNVAHRGGGMAAPEATLAAFAAAVAGGADVLEMDVHLTADGALVVIHDGSVDRTTDGSGSVAGMSLAELRELNAGHRFRDAGGGFPYRGNPVRVPTLAEVFAEHPGHRFMVEMKAADAAEPLCEEIRAAGLGERTLAAAIGQDALDRFRRACPEVATGASFREAVWFLLLSFAGLGEFFETPANALLVSEAAGPLPVVTPRFLRAARRAGLPVFVWTVNRPETMARLLDLGVDGILTDDPPALARLLATRR